MRDPDEYDALEGAAKGASAGSVAGPWGAVIGGVVGATTPFLSKALHGVFGVDNAENAEKAALSSLRRVADGGTTQGQAGMAYARGKTLQDLQGLANRGTAQQRAGLQRQAMQQAPGVQAQYASQLADLRSREQERAASQVALIEGSRAAAEAARKRAALSGSMQSAVSMGTKLGMAAGSPGPVDPNKLSEKSAVAYNAQNTKGTAGYTPFGSSGDQGAGWAALSTQLGKVEDGPEYKAQGQALKQGYGNTGISALPGALTQPTMLQPSPAAQAQMSDQFPNVAPAANIFQKATPSAFAKKQIKALETDPYAVVRNRTPQVDFGNYGTAFIDDEGEAKVPGYKPRKNSAGGMGL